VKKNGQKNRQEDIEMLTILAPQTLLRMRLGRLDRDTCFFYFTGLKNKGVALVLASLCLSASSLVFAEQSSAIAISAGQFDAFNDGVAEVGIEYRAAPLKSMYDLIPTAGVAINSDDSYWLYGGIRYDYHISRNWVLTPHIAASLYEDNGGKELGSVFQLRSGLEVAYKLSENSRLGVAYYHLSNAGLDTHNPGSNSVIISYSFSLDSF
jgi:hypothetical protein